MPSEDRFLPSLLDRLTDDDPGMKRPETDRFILDLERYRFAVVRDIDWLLNTTTSARPEEIEGLELTSGSVLNYGMPPLSGGTVLSIDPRALEQRIRDVIVRFEPRIVPTSVRIEVHLTGTVMSHRSLSFQLEGMLWAVPLPEQIYVRTEVDLETGHVAVADFGYREKG